MDQLRTVFYHHPCLDGSTAAWAVYQKLGDNARYVGLDHSDLPKIEKTITDNVTPETIAMFVDFAPKSEILENIIDKVQGVEIYDHHISAQHDLAAYMDHPKCHIYFDMNRSGAGMAFDIFSSGAERPLFVELVERIDLYKPERFDSAEQFYLVSSYLSSLDVDRPLEQILPDINDLAQIKNIDEFENKGEPYRQAYRKKIDAVMQDVDMANLAILETAPHCYEVPIAKANINDLGHEFSPVLLNACPHENKMGMVWEFHSPEVVKVSLRSDGNVDVSKIAEEMGTRFGMNGGGHKGASAVRFTFDQFKEFAEKIHLELNVIKPSL